MGEGSQIFLVRCRGAVGQGVLLGVVWMCVCVCVCLADFRSFWGGTVGQGLVGSVVWCAYAFEGGGATCWHTTHSLSFQRINELPCHSLSASTPMKFLIYVFTHIWFYLSLFVLNTILLFMFVSILPLNIYTRKDWNFILLYFESVS